jgi:hypothetical protein
LVKAHNYCRFVLSKALLSENETSEACESHSCKNITKPLVGFYFFILSIMIGFFSEIFSLRKQNKTSDLLLFS